MKKLTVALLCILLLFSSAPVSIFGSAENAGAEVISYAIFKDGEAISCSENNTLYPTGSLSKIFTAALTLKLCEQGKIEIDGKICEYIKNFTMEDERYKDITVRHLLNHTSGLFGSTIKNSMLYNDIDTWNHDNFLSLMSDQRLKYEPGKMANYCNDGYTVLELLIEEVTGVSYTVYLHDIFDEFIDSNKLKTAAEIDFFCDEIVNFIGSGGIYSDAKTISEAIYLISCTDLILNQESKKLMESVRGGAYPGEEFGAGWDNVNSYPFDKYGIKVLSKGGDTVNYHSFVAVLPEKGISASVMLKGGDSRVAGAMAQNLIIEYLKENEGTVVEYYSFDKPEMGNTDDIVNLKIYEGIYLSSAGQFEFRIGSGFALVKDIYKGKSVPYTYLGNGVFDTGNGILYFSEINGETYMVTEGITPIGEDGKIRSIEYFGVKKSGGVKTHSEWLERNGKIYFICDEKYTSTLHLQGISAVMIGFSEEMPGYLNYLKLENENKALADIELPLARGRDLTDIEIVTENGKEYLKSQEWTFVDYSTIPNLYNGAKSVCTILPDGYTRWFKAGETQGKRISAEINGTGAFALYDASGLCVYSSLRDSFEITVPENGYLAFSGEKGTVFEITLA